MKKLHGFSYYKNIANFEAFWWEKNFSKNILFLGSEISQYLGLGILSIINILSKTNDYICFID